MTKNETSKVNETKSSVIGKVVNKDFTMNNPPPPPKRKNI